LNDIQTPLSYILMRILLPLLLLCTSLAHAGLINLEFEGRIKKEGVPYNGKGLFKFHITDYEGRLLWAHKMERVKAGYASVGHLELDVVDGNYRVALGDSDKGMPQMSTEYLWRISDPHLEIWFSDGESEFEEIAAYPISLDPQFNIPRDPLVVRRLLVDQRKENVTLKRQLMVERVNRRRAEAMAKKAAEPAPPPKRGEPRRFSVKTNTYRPEVMGSADAPVVMMEFTDLQCPICKAWHAEAYEEIKRTYIDSGQMLYIHAHLPLPSHPDALRAAQVLSCAGEQGQFWEMRDALFENQHDLSMDAMKGYAMNLGLDVEVLDECLKQPDVVLEINKQRQFAAQMGIKATPTFVLGRIVDGQLDGDIYVGSRSFDFLSERIEAILTDASSGKEEQP